MVFSGQNFYHGLLTKYHASFGSLFSDIVIQRHSADGSIEQQIKVPLHWGQKEKMLLRVEALPDADRPIALQLPLISYEFVQPVYATNRKGISVVRNVRKIDDDPDKFKLQYNAVPFDLYYNVYVYSKTIEDGNKIIEQILVMFTPDFTITMMLIPEMNDIRDIPIRMIPNPTYEDLGKVDNPMERRILIWTLQFVAHAWLFGPVKRRAIIKQIITNFRLDNRHANPEDREWPSFDIITDEDAPIATYTEEYPGLTANGEPTSNASNAIDWHLVEVDDNWGVVVVKHAPISNTP